MLIGLSFQTVCMLPANANPASFQIKNATRERGAWATIYRRNLKDYIVTAYCIGPGTTSNRSFRDAYKVVVEAKREKNCHGSTLGRHGADATNRYRNAIVTMKETNGRIQFTNGICSVDPWC